MAKKKGASLGPTLGGMIVGFDQQVFRTTPPVNELVAKGTPLRAVASAGGTLSVGMPGDPIDPDEATRVGPTQEAPGEPTVLRLAATGVEISIDLLRGGRVASAVIDGREILVVDDSDPLRWGSYPMAPYAGRVRHGRFSFRGREYDLPLGIPLHAIHGTVRHRRWRVIDDRAIATDLGPDWPFAGRVVQRFDLEPGRFGIHMSVEADEPMPASIGWHPWFARRPVWVGPGVGSAASDPTPGDLELLLDAGSVYAKDGEDIASRDRVPPPPGPWDECFTDLRRPPILRWPGFLELTIESACTDWVVYTEPGHALCVEPQTAPPDALNQDPTVVEPGEPLIAEMTWRWRSLAL